MANLLSSRGGENFTAIKEESGSNFGKLSGFSILPRRSIYGKKGFMQQATPLYLLHVSESLLCFIVLLSDFPRRSPIVFVFVNRDYLAKIKDLRFDGHFYGFPVKHHEPDILFLKVP